jgi:uncharacterized protein YkwD
MKRVLAVLLLVSGLSFAGGDRPEKVKLSADEKALLDLLNQARKKEKLAELLFALTSAASGVDSVGELKKQKMAELVLDPLLSKIARQHCGNMAKQEKMSHVLDGKRVGDRATEAGYDYRAIGENIARSSPDSNVDAAPTPPAEIHEMWMKSKGHRANILNPRYREVGLSIVRDKKGTYYYTQVFGVRRE